MPESSYSDAPFGTLEQQRRIQRCWKTCGGGSESKQARKQFFLGESKLTASKSFLGPRRAIPLWTIVLLAFAIHGPLMLMQLPANSYDTNFNIFFASHYAHHWFNPWNEKWFAGFSQTTYPPLPQQWTALLSYLVGLPMAYMLVQLAAILLFPVAVFRYAQIWVHERAGRYASGAIVFP